MANTCITSWALKGLSPTIGLIAAAIENVSSQPHPHPWDRPLLSGTAALLGIPEDGVPYSEIVHFKREESPNILHLSTEDRGVPPLDFFKALRERFPDLEIRYLAECFEDDLFETNDMEGEFFPERYALDFETSLVPDADPVYYFNGEKELLDFVKETFDREYGSAASVAANLEEDLYEKDETAFVSLHTAEVTTNLR